MNSKSKKQDRSTPPNLGLAELIDQTIQNLSDGVIAARLNHYEQLTKLDELTLLSQEEITSRCLDEDEIRNQLFDIFGEIFEQKFPLTPDRFTKLVIGLGVDVNGYNKKDLSTKKALFSFLRSRLINQTARSKRESLKKLVSAGVPSVNITSGTLSIPLILDLGSREGDPLLSDELREQETSTKVSSPPITVIIEDGKPIQRKMEELKLKAKLDISNAANERIGMLTIEFKID